MHGACGHGGAAPQVGSCVERRAGEEVGERVVQVQAQEQGGGGEREAEHHQLLPVGEQAETSRDPEDSAEGASQPVLRQAQRAPPLA